MDLEQLKKLLRSYNLKPNFTYGQNFLIDDIVLRDIVDAAEVALGDVVLEIGPGMGNLTRLLCERALRQSPSNSSPNQSSDSGTGQAGTGQAGFVLSIEKDPKFLPILKAIKKEYPENFRYEIADALEFDFQETLNNAEFNAEARGSENLEFRVLSRQVSRPSAVYKVVANIPYFITGKILQMLMTAKNKPSSITILTQKEVAQNIAAGPGKLSVLAISVQLFGQPKIIQIVPAKSFYPIPKVNSAIVQIIPYQVIPYKIFDQKIFFKVIKACFAGKRKQIHNTLVNNLRLDKNFVTGMLSELKISSAARPQELSIEKWIELTSRVSEVQREAQS